MDKDFKRAYEYTARQIDSDLCALATDEWIDDIDGSIEELALLMEKEAEEKNLDVKQLKGFIAEIWHAKTLEINEKIHSDDVLVSRPDSNERGSSDIDVDGHGNSLKYYGTAKDSAKNMAETYWERFNRLNSKRIKKGLQDLNYEEYLKENGLKSDEEARMSFYYGQGKVVPCDQLLAVKHELIKRIGRANNDIQRKRYEEVLRTISDVVKDKNGNESIRLSEEQSRILGQAAKDRNVEELLEDFGIDTKYLIEDADIFNKAMSAGLSAAALTAIINLCPIVFNALSKYISSGEIDIEELKNGGIAALKGTGKALVNGTMTSAVVGFLKSGKLGEELENADANVISAFVVILMNVVDLSIKRTKGEINDKELVREMMRSMIISVSSIAGSKTADAVLTSLTIAFPQFEALIITITPAVKMLGSFLGSMIGGFVYQVTDRILISYCVESGCTFFGFVDQNHSLPKEVLIELGLDIIDFNEMEINEFEPEQFVPEYFDLEEFKYEKVGLVVLRRDLIGVQSVGYAIE